MTLGVGDGIVLPFESGRVALEVVGVEKPNGSIMCRDESGSLVIIPESWKRYLVQPSSMPTAPGTVIEYANEAWMLMTWPSRWMSAGHSSKTPSDFIGDNYRIIHMPMGGAYL